MSSKCWPSSPSQHFRLLCKTNKTIWTQFKLSRTPFSPTRALRVSNVSITQAMIARKNSIFQMQTRANGPKTKTLTLWALNSALTMARLLRSLSYSTTMTMTRMRQQSLKLVFMISLRVQSKQLSLNSSRWPLVLTTTVILVKHARRKYTLNSRDVSATKSVVAPIKSWFLVLDLLQANQKFLHTASRSVLGSMNQATQLSTSHSPPPAHEILELCSEP